MEIITSVRGDLLRFNTRLGDVFRTIGFLRIEEASGFINHWFNTLKYCNKLQLKRRHY